MVASVTESNNPQASLLVTIILVGGLITLSKSAGVTVYKNVLIGIVDTILCFNLLALYTFSLYHFKVANITELTAVVYTSTIITFTLLVGVIIYHASLLIRKNRPPKKCNASPPALQG